MKSTLSTNIEGKAYAANYNESESDQKKSFEEFAKNAGTTPSGLLKQLVEALLSGQYTVQVSPEIERLKNYYQGQIDILSKERDNAVRTIQNKGGLAGIPTVDDVINQRLAEQKQEHKIERMQDEINVLTDEVAELNSELEQAEATAEALKLENTELRSKASMWSGVQQIAPALGVGLGNVPAVKNFFEALSSGFSGALGSTPVGEDGVKLEWAREYYDRITLLDKEKFDFILSIFIQERAVFDNTYQFLSQPREI